MRCSKTGAAVQLDPKSQFGCLRLKLLRVSKEPRWFFQSMVPVESFGVHSAVTPTALALTGVYECMQPTHMTDSEVIRLLDVLAVHTLGNVPPR